MVVDAERACHWSVLVTLVVIATMLIIIMVTKFSVSAITSLPEETT